jgi:FkbM family methyltransferase
MMKNSIKQSILGYIRRQGFDVSRYSPELRGVDPLQDMRHFLQSMRSPVIFDVGANVGQSVVKFRGMFPGAMIHSFETSPTTFSTLSVNCENQPDVHLWNVGVGANAGTLPFLENSHAVMSSFLPPDEAAWGTVVKTTEVPVVTLDGFAMEHDIPYIHVLKSDTQGYDLEVFKGAEELMSQNRIGLIYFEIILSRMYENLPSFQETMGYLLDRNFILVSFYESNFQNDVTSWTDALLINREFHKRFLEDVRK